jgi:tripartite-type tricarboxylate transporter receptor subunit TctC
MDLAIRILRWIAFMLLALTEGGELNVPEVRVAARSIGRKGKRKDGVGEGDNKAQNAPGAKGQAAADPTRGEKPKREGRAKAEIMSPPKPDQGPNPEAALTKIEPVASTNNQSGE